MSKVKKSWVSKKRYARNRWFKDRQLLRSAVRFINKNWFIPREINKDGVNIAYGPRNGILFLSDTNEELTMPPLEKLNLIFSYGDFSTDIGLFPFISDFTPYISKKFASELLSTHIKRKEAINFADEYGYVYVIDASKSSNLSCIPNSQSNSRNKKFMQDIDLDFYCMDKNNPNFYILTSSFKSSFIIGAFATQYLAFSLNISEETLIVNPNYAGDLAAIKTKLQVSHIKAFKDCVAQTSNYRDAEMAYESSSTGLNRRFLAVWQRLEKIHTAYGLEKVIYALPAMKQIIDSTPFTSSQLSIIQQVFTLSKKANICVHAAFKACLQFEQGFYDRQSSIRFLPELVRHKIYSNVYPVVQKNEFIDKKARGHFVRTIDKAANEFCFFSKQRQNKTFQTEQTENNPQQRGGQVREFIATFC